VLSVPTGLLLGALLGMRHALEPDHLAAVSTLVTDRRDVRAGAMLGALWGVGHTVALLGMAALLHALRAELPILLTSVFELGVSAMLIALGARALLRAVRQGARGALTAHHHGRVLHAHTGRADHVHLGPLTLARPPLLIGLLHGLAGSGALTALALAHVTNIPARFAFMALFGLGSILGMAALSGAIGWPIAHFSRRQDVARWLVATSGGLSLCVGVSWAGKALALL
jgi:ABC-type nickel/cobalt efflux system permease component RcnA